MEEQHIATYHFDGINVEIYGIIYNDTPINEFENYDLWLEENEQRHCINEGYYLFKWPSWSKTKELLEEFQTKEKV